MHYILSAAVILAVFLPTTRVQAQDNKKQTQPNILWLFQEDLSPWLGCYGHEVQRGQTPVIDALATGGVRFSRAYVPAPVCSICRSAIITGANQIRFGAHEHRSRRGKAELPLPEGMRTIPELLTQAGYFCFNVGKTDYNFEHSKVYQNIPKGTKNMPWRARPAGQPFFGQIQLKGGKLNTTKFKNKTDRSQVTIPADYPQTELYREIVAEHYDSARMDDRVIGKILDRLEADGLRDSTIVVYFSDHGANNLVRHKQQPTEGGSHVPFIINGPAPWVPGPEVRDDLVSLLDLSATTLAWAGVDQPDWMEGRDLFNTNFRPRQFVATARDRCDQTIDRIRSIRTDRFRLTRNYMLDRVLLQPQYRDNRDYVRALRTGYADGTLDPKLAKIYFGERPPEEFYDVEKDPAQMHNLIDDPQHSDEVKRHRELLDSWLAQGDSGAGEESAIELEMASNKRWGRGVNAEYESIRKDSDGDGLSDEWEEINHRDPSDGKLRFEFDCGGWQTEGWQSIGKVTNLAGDQGFLEFKLTEGNGSIRRDGLNMEPRMLSSGLVIRLRNNHPTRMTLSINEKKLDSVELPVSATWQEVALPIADITAKKINSLSINFAALPEATMEIDWVRSKQ
ncbi:MAG: sulfatase-like hydrolase/transferase [Pirellulaceae bacterium]|nr:sulfatase-like hydrolase/transferase [Pirellulaceae bacterium]